MNDVIFVERIFESGEDTLTARFLQPTLEPGGEYQCRWTILWPDRAQHGHICGLDGVQALMLAMRYVHGKLMGSDLYKSGRLTYVNQYDLDLPPSWGEGQLYVPPDQNRS